MKKATYIFTTIALLYFLGHIFTALKNAGNYLTAGLLGAAIITVFSIVYTKYTTK